MGNKYNKKNSTGPEDKGAPDTREKILRYTEDLSVPGKVPKEVAFARLAERIEKGDRSISIPAGLSISYLYWGAAASILVITGILILLLRNTEIQVVAKKGEHIEHRLPDGSTVTLNAASEIIYDKKSFTQNRALHLEGEAIFTVENGTDFVIGTLQGEVEILGTRLNIYTRDDLFKVSCLSGKVKVSAGSGSDIITAGESIKLSGTELVKEKEAAVERAVSWEKGVFHYENIPVNSIFDEIERQFKVSVESRGTENRYFTGSFRSSDLDEALEVICIPMAFSYKFEGKNKIIINNQVRQHTP